MTRIWTNLAIGAVVALVATACGNGSGTSVETTTPEEAATTTTEVVGTTAAQEPSDETVTTEQARETSTTTTAPQDEGANSVRTVDIVMTDFAFEPENLEVTAGETIRFVVVNEGAVDHEFRLSNSHRIEEHLASDHGDHEEEEEGHHEEDGDVFVVLEPGETGELTVTVPEDETVYTETACLLPGHYEAGMKGGISYTDG
jgi:uncharacterized cupredoxin-like copper-binding protein